MPTPPQLPPISDQPISLVLLQPGEDRDAIVAAWNEFFDSRKIERQIIVVENAAGDGAALRDGLAQAQHPLICHAPCHADYRPEFLGLLLDRPFLGEELAEGTSPGKELDYVHLMSGFRAGVPMPWPFRVLGAIWRLIVRIVLSYSPTPWPGWLGWRRYLGAWFCRMIFGVHYRDVCCPFRLFRREILIHLPIQSDSAFAHVELAAKANFLDCVLSEEQPLPVRPGPYRGDFSRFRREAARLFQQPDFGPPPEREPSQVSVEG